MVLYHKNNKIYTHEERLKILFTTLDHLVHFVMYRFLTYVYVAPLGRAVAWHSLLCPVAGINFHLRHKRPNMLEKTLFLLLNTELSS